MTKKVTSAADIETPLIVVDAPYPRVEMAYPKAPISKKGDNNEVDLTSLYSARAKYTADEKLAAVLAYVMRKKPSIVAVIGLVWTVVGAWQYLEKEKPVGLGFFLAGSVCLIWGGINLWRTRRAAGRGRPAGDLG